MKIGIFGKLPGYGDFINYNITTAIQSVLEQWIRKSFEHLQLHLGINWKDEFKSSVTWQVTFGKNTVNNDYPMVALMMPSWDSVGRCYPLFICAEFNRELNPFTLSRIALPCQEQANTLISSIHEASSPDVEQIAQRLQSVYEQLTINLANPAPMNGPLFHGEHTTISDIIHPDVSVCHENLLNGLVKSTPITIWHTKSVPTVTARFRYFQGMPAADDFHTFLLRREH